MVLLTALIPAVISILLWFRIYREWDATEAYKAQVNKKEYHALRLKIFFILVGLAGQVLYWFIMLGIVQSTAKSNLISLNHTANSIYRLSEKWLDLHENQENHLEGIYNFSDKAEPDSFAEYLNKTAVNAEGWYAIICDENQNPEYVLYSKKEITQDNLKIPEKEEQLKILSRLIRDRWEAIGYSHADYVFNQETQTTETVQTEETTE